MTTEQIAKEMFVSYNGQGPTPWKTFDGRDVPRWDALPEAVREKWVCAAETAVNRVCATLGGVLKEFGETWPRAARLAPEKP